MTRIQLLGVDPALGPEMRSTGEVMGLGDNFGEAFAKAQLSAGVPLPDLGRLFLSVNDRDKPAAAGVARRFAELDFELAATRGTAGAIRQTGLAVKVVFKVNEGRPNAVDLLKAGSLNLIVYTGTAGPHAFADEKAIRRSAVTHRISCITTMSGARRRGGDCQPPPRSYSCLESSGNSRPCRFRAKISEC